MLKPNYVALVCCVMVIATSVMAQTSNDLEQKYGRRGNQLVRRIGYNVRPGIIMTVSFARDGEVCEAVIEPQRVSKSGVDDGRLIPAAVAEEIVNEVVPAGQRGKRTGGLIFGNYTSWVREEYEYVLMTKLLVGVGGLDKDLKMDEVRIRWKQRQCY